MGVSFKDAIDNELISESILRMLPRKCRCGSEFEFNDSLKRVMCTNKQCIYKIVDRLSAFCSELNIDISTSEIIKLTTKLKLVTPYQLLMIEDAYEANILNSSDICNIQSVIKEIQRIKNNKYYLYEIARLDFVYNIKNIEYKLFRGFNSFIDAFNEIESGQVSFINERLGIKESDSSVLSVNIYNTLMKIKDELIFGETQLNIKEYDKNILNIAFCDNILPYINKSELLDVLNSSYKQYEFVLVTTVSENTDILIRNAGNSNQKYRAARLINDKFTADQMNNCKITLKEVGSFKDKDLKPLGNKVFITTLDGLINRLNIIRD